MQLEIPTITTINSRITINNAATLTAAVEYLVESLTLKYIVVKNTKKASSNIDVAINIYQSFKIKNKGNDKFNYQQHLEILVE